jgi:pimeloyl-ACP methyl ester carboxylesterase
VDRKPHVPKVASFGAIGRDGYRIVKITLQTEPGVQVPALVLEPSSAAGRKSAVLYLNPEGKSADAAPGGDIEALARAGYLVLAPDLRGWGETAASGGHFPHDGRYHLSMRAMLVGRTVVGMQATDLLATFDYLASRPDVDSNRIGVFSKGNAEVVALLTAVLEPRIHRVACESGPVSYLDIVQARFHGEIADVAIPGVLEQFDLPDVAATIAPRKLWLVDSTMPSGEPELLGKVTPEYQSAERAYAGLNASKDFRITTRPEGWAFAKVYGEWLSR